MRLRSLSLSDAFTLRRESPFFAKRDESQLICRFSTHSVIEGFRIASKTALAALENSATDNGKDPAAFREDLLAIARTTLSSKVLAADKDYFAELAVSAVLRLKGSTDLEHIQIIKKQGGKLTDSYLDEGFILDKKMGVNCPHKIENAKILIANTRKSIFALYD